MAMRITGLKTVSATTAAQDVNIGYNAFLIQNNGTGKVYFKEKHEDGRPASASNGFCLPAGTTLEHVLTAKTLSIVADAASSVVILLLDIG